MIIYTTKLLRDRYKLNMPEECANNAKTIKSIIEK